MDRSLEHLSTAAGVKDFTSVLSELERSRDAEHLLGKCGFLYGPQPRKVGENQRHLHQEFVLESPQ